MTKRIIVLIVCVLVEGCGRIVVLCCVVLYCGVLYYSVSRSLSFIALLVVGCPSITFLDLCYYLLA